MMPSEQAPDRVCLFHEKLEDVVESENPDEPAVIVGDGKTPNVACRHLRERGIDRDLLGLRPG